MAIPVRQILEVEEADENELYEVMDWLLENQGKIEANLAAKHLEEGTLILYDVTSTYFEGETCPLAQYGYSRDKKKGSLQILVDFVTRLVVPSPWKYLKEMLMTLRH